MNLYLLTHSARVIDFILTFLPLEASCKVNVSATSASAASTRIPDRQLEQIEVGKVFTDKASGKDTQRPELERLLVFVREATPWWCIAWTGWHATLMTCAASSGLTQRGVRMEFVKEGLTFTGEDSPMANLMLSVMGSLC